MQAAGAAVIIHISSGEGPFDGEERPQTSAEREALMARFGEVRGLSQSLAADLAPEDQVVQSMPDCSPVDWHLAHVT